MANNRKINEAQFNWIKSELQSGKSASSIARGMDVSDPTIGKIKRSPTYEDYVNYGSNTNLINRNIEALTRRIKSLEEHNRILQISLRNQVDDIYTLKLNIQREYLKKPAIFRKGE